MIVEQRPASGASRRRNERNTTSWQAGVGERWDQRMVHDRFGGTEGIAADAQHRRVARAKHTSCICKYIWAALEHKAHDTQWSALRSNTPPSVMHLFNDLLARRRGVSPDPKAVDHVGTHALRQLQASGRSAASCGRLHVEVIGCSHKREHVVVFECCSERIEERRNLFVRYGGERCKRLNRVINSRANQRKLRRRNVQ